MGKKNKIISVDDITITVTNINEKDYICLTDMVSKHSEGSKLIEKWLTSKNTIEFLGIWEQLNNKDFNSPEFGGIMSEAGTNRFYMSVKQWNSRTNGVGLVARAGKYGGTYAHKDIAFNFGLYISPMFNLLLIKEFQRLKEIEHNKYGLEWDVRRILSKTNYHVQTDAIKKYIVPQSGYRKTREYLLYADEADLLNLVLFKCTAKEWRELNPQRVLNGENVRDMASINELAILSNLESLNSTLIKNGLDKKNRYRILLETSQEQKETLDKIDYIKSIKKLTGDTYIQEKEASPITSFDKNLKKALKYNPKE